MIDLGLRGENGTVPVCDARGDDPRKAASGCRCVVVDLHRGTGREFARLQLDFIGASALMRIYLKLVIDSTSGRIFLHRRIGRRNEDGCVQTDWMLLAVCV